MAMAVEPKSHTLVPEQRFLIPRVGWVGYQRMLEVVGERRSIRITYDRGDLELMSPSYDHERFGEPLGRVVASVTEELRIPCICARSTTWRKKFVDRGLEADTCFYLESSARIRGKRTIDLNVDPPPDLAIEVEISRGALDRMGIYASLGVPEVWRFDGETLQVEHLQPDGTHAQVTASPSFPFLPLDEVVRWVNRPEAIENHSEWGRRFREWVREELVPRAGRP